MSTATTLPTPAHSVSGYASQNDVAMTDESPNKRKRALDDDGDRELKKVQLEGHRLGVEDLHLDVGDKYLLCQIRKTTFAALLLPCAQGRGSPQAQLRLRWRGPILTVAGSVV
jgi:hypothetical protein